MNRRRFLTHNLTLMAAGLVPSLDAAPFVQNSIQQLPLSQDQMTQECFSSYLGQHFLVYDNSDVQIVEKLRLAEVLDQGSNDLLEQFCLRFEAAADSALQQRTYHLQHPDSAPIQLWLDPGEIKQGRRMVWANFNLLKNCSAGIWG